MTVREVPPILTDRQQQVLELTCNGYGGREAGVELGISESAIRKHLEVLRHKLRVGRKRDLVREAKRLGLVR